MWTWMPNYLQGVKVGVGPLHRLLGSLAYILP